MNSKERVLFPLTHYCKSTDVISQDDVSFHLSNKSEESLRNFSDINWHIISIGED